MSTAGLVPAMALAVKTGLSELADAWLTLPGYFGANAGLKFTALFAAAGRPNQVDWWIEAKAARLARSRH